MTTTTLTEPADGVTVVVRDVDGDIIPVTRNDTHPTASGEDRWLDLTCPEAERVAYPWAEIAPQVAVELGTPIDPATTPEPDEGGVVVVARINTTTGVANWYTITRDGNDPLSDDDLAILAEEDDADAGVDPTQRRWFLQQCFAERNSRWGDAWGRFLWSEIGVESDPALPVAVTVYHPTITAQP